MILRLHLIFFLRKDSFLSPILLFFDPPVKSRLSVLGSACFRVKITFLLCEASSVGGLRLQASTLIILFLQGRGQRLRGPLGLIRRSADIPDAESQRSRPLAHRGH